MSIKIANIEVIDNSRNLLNVASFTATGISSITANSSLPALKIQQRGSGNSLLIKDNSGNNSKVFVIDSTGRLGLGTASIPTTTKVIVDKPVPTIALRTKGVSYNSVFGWTLEENSGNLNINRQTNFGFTSPNTVLTMTNSNRVGINFSQPTRTLDIKGSFAVQSTQNVGVSYLPETLPSGGDNNVIAARNTITNFNQPLFINANVIKIRTGANTGSTASDALTITPNSVGLTDVVFSNNVIAENFAGFELGWCLLSSVSPSGSSVDIQLSDELNSFNSYAIIFDNVRPSTTSAALSIDLRDAANSLIGGGTYRYSIWRIPSVGDVTAIPVIGDNVNVWQITGFPLTPGSEAGTASGELVFYNLKSSASRKQVTGTAISYYTDGTVQEVYSFLGGDMSSSTNVSFVRIFLSSGNFQSGTFKLYGIRT